MSLSITDHIPFYYISWAFQGSFTEVSLSISESLSQPGLKVFHKQPLSAIFMKGCTPKNGTQASCDELCTYILTLLLIHPHCQQSQCLYSYHAYSALKPLTCRILICFTMVLFPDSPAPEKERWQYYGSIDMSTSITHRDKVLGYGQCTFIWYATLEYVHSNAILCTCMIITWMWLTVLYRKVSMSKQQISYKTVTFLFRENWG